MNILRGIGSALITGITLVVGVIVALAVLALVAFAARFGWEYGA